VIERKSALDRSAIEEETSTTTTTTIIIIIHYSWQFYWNLNSLYRFSKILTLWNSFRWESSCSRPLDGHSGMKIIIALRNFTKAPKNGSPVWIGRISNTSFSHIHQHTWQRTAKCKDGRMTEAIHPSTNPPSPSISLPLSNEFDWHTNSLYKNGFSPVSPKPFLLDLTLTGPCVLRISQYISNKIQRNTVCLIWKLLYMFRAVPHLSSGAHVTLSTASGICHTVIATCHYRWRDGTSVPTLPR
jgi:hypothetical protein